MTRINRLRKIGLALLATGLLAAAIGCSSDRNPMTSAGGGADSPLRRSASGDVEIAGRVNAVDTGARTITLVNNATLIVVQAGAEIVFRGVTDVPITLAEINAGDSVEARGQVQGDGSLSADRIRVRSFDDNGGANEMEFGGRVASIDPASRTMQFVGNGTLITVMAGAEIVQKLSGEELPIGLEEIAIGDSVDVRGTLQADGSLLADRVRLRISDEDFASDLEFKSTITSIDYAGQSFTVASRSETITVDAASFIFYKASSGGGSTPASKRGSDDDDEDGTYLRQPLAFSDLSLGDSVEVYANFVDPTTLYAVAIELEDGAMETGLEIEFKAVLASVDVSSGAITFTGQSWMGQVDANSDLRGFSNDVLTLADFAVGQLVEVRGYRTSTSTFRVVHMHKDNN